MADGYDGFERHDLDGQHAFFTGSLPADLKLDEGRFEALWALHPEDYHEIKMHGRPVKTPRWQQAYGRDYHYTGQTNRAQPVPSLLEPLLRWSREAIHDRLNGLLLNWYDGRLRHYIGPHHDSTKFMVPGAPIVTISLGEGRTFRLSLPRTRERRDFEAADGAVFVMPYDTNLVWKHEVPASSRHRNRRISVTLRAFEDRRET
jgi:alkylated DNA repair dioxygenase AlkB